MKNRNLKLNKFISMLLVISLCLCFCSGCKKEEEPIEEESIVLPYNAEVIVSDGFGIYYTIVPPEPHWFTKNFWRTNTIRVSYDDEDPWELHLDRGKLRSPEYADYYNEHYPEFRIVMISTQEEYDKTFLEPREIDFEKQMILIYLDNAHTGNTRSVTDIVLEDGNLTIKWKSVRIGDFTNPTNRFMIVKMDKVKCDKISFAYTYSNGNIAQDMVDSITLNQ